VTAGETPSPVSVCVLRLSRIGTQVRISVAVAPDVQAPDVERFETVDLEIALDAVRQAVQRLRS
jgi:hypothetical protein